MSNTLETAFDVDNEEGTPPRELLPAGKYKAEITAASVGPTKNGRGQMVSLTWGISEGDYEKRLVFQSILIQHDSADAQRFGRQKFKDVCDCELACKKDPLFGVIGIQSGPRDRGSTLASMILGSRGWDAGRGDDCEDLPRVF